MGAQRQTNILRLFIGKRLSKLKKISKATKLRNKNLQETGKYLPTLVDEEKIDGHFASEKSHFIPIIRIGLSLAEIGENWLAFQQRLIRWPTGGPTITSEFRRRPSRR